jgi:hypothetical protein
MALRLLAFKQIFKILGMEKLEFSTHYYNNNKLPRKRQYPAGENENQSK